MDNQVGTTGQSVLLESLASPEHRITATPDLAPGDVLDWQGDVEVFADGSFAARGSFQVGMDGTWAWQTMGDMEPPPDLEPEPPPEPPPPEPEPPPKEKGPPPGKGWRK